MESKFKGSGGYKIKTHNSNPTFPPPNPNAKAATTRSKAIIGKGGFRIAHPTIGNYKNNLAQKFVTKIPIYADDGQLTNKASAAFVVSEYNACQKIAKI